MMSARCPPVAGARGVMTQPTASSASSLPSPERHARILLSGEEKKYKGVRRRKWGRWVSEIRLPNSRDRIWLGSYDTPSKAARAFDAAYLCLRGPGGGGDGHGLNFPDSPPPLVARTTHPREVHAAAVSHANRAAAAAPPLGDDDATEPPPSEPMQARAPLETTAAAAAPSRLEVQQGSDWWWLQQVDDTTPLYSPANAYLFPALPVAADPDDGDMEENGSGACHDLWCFDSGEAPRI